MASRFLPIFGVGKGAKPIICSMHFKTIKLSARPADSLKWPLHAIPEGDKILWEWDLGLTVPYFPLDDPFHFETLGVALSQFSQKVWPVFQERTQGAILYRGSVDFSEGFSWSEKQQENWSAWIQDQPPAPEAHLRRLFCADAWVHYLQMLSYRLPDEMPLYLFCDATGIESVIERHQLLSKERFEHFHLAVKGLPYWVGLDWEGKESVAPSLALCMPEQAACNGYILRQLELWTENFSKPLRIIPEPFLTEEWDGVDELYVLSQALSAQGKRKLEGFLASGGKVHSIP